MSDHQLRWGVLSGARIAQQKVIPAIQDSQRGTVKAIASRHCSQASQIAQEHRIPVVCPTYDHLINLDTIDAVYIPLPNHLHVKWACKAVKAGKHVLCEKPLGLNESDVHRLRHISKDYPELVIAEAFMYRHHPQWIYTHELIRSGSIGELRQVHVHFSYENLDPDNIRNKVEFGGGALMDIGCYGISVARWLFGTEPIQICAQMKRHPKFKTDILTTVLLDFAQGSATVVCGTQMCRSQSVQLIGSEGRIILPMPFNIPPNEHAQLDLLKNFDVSTHNLQSSDQFSEQCDAFAGAVFDGQPFPTPIADSLHNMRVIDACFRSEQEHAWISC